MSLIICLFGPSLIGFILLEHLQKEKFNVRDSIINFALIVTIVNFISTIVSVLFFQIQDNLLIKLHDYPFLAVKYGVISMIVSVLIAIIIRYLKINIDLSLEAKNIEKKKKNGKK